MEAWMIGALLIIVFYFLPFMVALSRNTINKGAVFIINLFFGWTVIFWIVALIMAYWKTIKEQKLQEQFYQNNIKK